MVNPSPATSTTGSDQRGRRARIGGRVRLRRDRAVEGADELNVRRLDVEQGHRFARRRPVDRSSLTGGARRLVMRVVRLSAAGFDMRYCSPVAPLTQRGDGDDQLRRHHQNGEDGVQPAFATRRVSSSRHPHNPTAEAGQTLAQIATRGSPDSIRRRRTTTRRQTTTRATRTTHRYIDVDIKRSPNPLWYTGYKRPLPPAQ